eukprot:1145487-Pelagomonas_calceolata.AAC.3
MKQESTAVWVGHIPESFVCHRCTFQICCKKASSTPAHYRKVVLFCLAGVATLQDTFVHIQADKTMFVDGQEALKFAQEACITTRHLHSLKAHPLW